MHEECVMPLDSAFYCHKCDRGFQDSTPSMMHFSGYILHQERPRRPFNPRGRSYGRRGRGSERGTKSRYQNSNPSSSNPPSSTASQSESLDFAIPDTPFLNSKAHPIAVMDKSCPYPGWLLYFPIRVYSPTSKSAIYTKYFIKFLETALRKSGYNPTMQLQSQTSTTPSEPGTPIDWYRTESQGAVLIDYPTLLLQSVSADETVPDLFNVFGDDVEGGAVSAEQCECVIQSVGLAIHTLCYRAVYKTEIKLECPTANQENVVRTAQIPSYIVGRIVHHGPITPLRKLRAHHLGRFISVKGIVVRIGHVEPVCRRLTFECASCGMDQLLILPIDGRFTSPTNCLTRGCRSRSFEPNLNHTDTLTMDTQVITVQESLELEADRTPGEQGTSASSLGRSPRCLSCRLTADLVDGCIPGDVVHLSGVVTLLNADGLAPSTYSSSSWTGRRGGNMFHLLLDVNSIVKVGGGSGVSQTARTQSGMSSSARRDPGLLVISDNSQKQPLGDAKDAGSSQQALSSGDSDFSVRDLYAIREISEQPNLFRLLVASLSPNICGRGMVKAGLLLALFGGTQPGKAKSARRRQYAKQRSRHRQRQRRTSADGPHDEDSGTRVYSIGFADAMEGNDSTSASNSDCESDDDTMTENANLQEEDDGNNTPEASETTGDLDMSRRAASHLLIVGDPGLGKSQMLRAAASLAPRAIYVCGNTASAAGLTVSTIREGGANGGGFGLEAGALVLADQGCCCIDEFDKLACDPAVLLEAMEQQTVSVARGGLVANLPARAAVLAAANPVGGHYDSTRRLEENLRIAPALLSRFDLIFVLLDRPDEAADRLLSEHVTAVHTGTWKPGSFMSHSTFDLSQPSDAHHQHVTVAELDPNAPLAERLELRLGEQLDLIPSVLLRKYILYARKYVMPSLSTEASTTLLDFYLELRRTRHTRDTFPVTLRQLESLVRLTEARARAELREEATKEDALDVCQLMQATGLGTGHVGGTPANASLSQIARMLPPPTRRSVSDTGPAAAKRLLSALESCWSVSENTKSRDFRRKRYKKQKGEFLATKDSATEGVKVDETEAKPDKKPEQGSTDNEEKRDL